MNGSMDDRRKRLERIYAYSADMPKPSDTPEYHEWMEEQPLRLPSEEYWDLMIGRLTKDQDPLVSELAGALSDTQGLNASLYELVADLRQNLEIEARKNAKLHQILCEKDAEIARLEKRERSTFQKLTDWVRFEFVSNVLKWVRVK